MSGLWVTMVEVRREAAPDPDWPDAAYVNLVGPAPDEESFRQAVLAHAVGLGYSVMAWEDQPEPLTSRFPRYPWGVQDRHIRRAVEAARASGGVESPSWHEWEAEEG